LKRLSLSQPYCRAVSWHHLIRRRRCKAINSTKQALDIQLE
jgi:hypothetical protein